MSTDAVESVRRYEYKIAGITQWLSCRDDGCPPATEYVLASDHDAVVATLTQRVERAEREKATVAMLATRLLDFIDNEGPPAREWQAITETAAELRAVLTASCAACGGKGSRDHVVDGVVESSDQCPACRAALAKVRS